MELGLERVRAVLARLGWQGAPWPVVTVAGTNGKGSVVALLEAACLAAGRRVGAYTSPHLVRFNERVRIGGAEAGDEALCEAFARVEAARGDIPLTYFEFATLAALVLFAEAGIEAAVLEVGLGGRLDAVNAVDPDVAVITQVALDHTEWLGPDREAIGAEKAGILRPGRPAVVGEAAPPRSVLEAAARLGAAIRVAGRDYRWEAAGGGWRFRCDGVDERLPAPALPGAHQLANAACARMAFELLRTHLAAPAAAFAEGLVRVRLAGRLQVVPGTPELVLDVAHNPAAAAALAAWLAACRRPTAAVLGMLADKDAAATVAALAPVVDAWHTIPLPGARGRSAEDLARAVRGAAPGAVVAAWPDVGAALAAARAAVPAQGRVVVTGSFLTVGAALPLVGAAP